MVVHDNDGRSWNFAVVTSPAIGMAKRTDPFFGCQKVDQFFNELFIRPPRFTVLVCLIRTTINTSQPAAFAVLLFRFPALPQHGYIFRDAKLPCGRAPWKSDNGLLIIE